MLANVPGLVELFAGLLTLRDLLVHQDRPCQVLPQVYIFPHSAAAKVAPGRSGKEPES